MLETVVVEYSGEIVLPDRPPQDLFSFTDTEGGQSARRITNVHTSDEPDITDGERS